MAFLNKSEELITPKEARIYGKRSHKVEKLKNLISEELSDVSS